MRVGMDIAAELALSGAAKTILSCRRPVHVVPRWVFGKPSDIAVQPWCAPGGSSPPRSAFQSYACNPLPGTLRQVYLLE